MKRVIIACLLILSTLAHDWTVATAETSITLIAVADNYPDSKYPKSAYGTRPVLYIGNSYDREQDIWGYERIFVRFDLSGLPKNHLIVQATLRLWQYYAPKSDQIYEAYRVLGDWDEVTQNWINQPPFSPARTSETIAPARTEVAVEWDLTSDVKAWYAGEAHNYGTMIKIATEERVRDASSGFWSREYPVDEWKPMLTVVLQSPSEYAVAIEVAGLPKTTLSEITVDGNSSRPASPSRDQTIIFDRGTVHNITVSKLVAGQTGVRYMCEPNQIQVTTDTAHVFTYITEYFVKFLAEPSDMFAMAPAGWYKSGASLSLNRTGPDQLNRDPGVRLVFDGWYVNGERLAVEPRTLIVGDPMVIEGRYRTEYYLTVKSAIGKTDGSGWYTKDSVATFSVNSTQVPADGVLGWLGVTREFGQWIGSPNLASHPTAPRSVVTMREPTEVEALWVQGWSPLSGGGVLVLIVVAVGIAAIVRARSHGQSVSRRKRQGGQDMAVLDLEGGLAIPVDRGPVCCTSMPAIDVVVQLDYAVSDGIPL